MKKSLLALFLSAIMLLCGCGAATADEPAGSVATQPSQATEAVKPAPKPTDTPEPNAETIQSLIELMQSNKAFTGESTVADVVDKLGADNIEGASLAYKSKLMGYPAVVKYIFSNSKDGTLPLTFMDFYIMPKKRNGYEKQLQELADSLETELGKHSAWAGEYPNYRWERDNYHVSLFYDSSKLFPVEFAEYVKVTGGSVRVRDKNNKTGKKLGVVHRGDTFELLGRGVWYKIKYKGAPAFISSRSDLTTVFEKTSSGVLASVNVTPMDDSVLPDIFSDIAVGTDIRTVYRSKTPALGLEDLARDPDLYHLNYSNKDTSIHLFFKVQGTEIKLCRAQYMTLLPDYGDEGIYKCFNSFGDSMEGIFGPAATREADKTGLHMSWPGLQIYAYNDSLHKNYYIDTIFSEEYFAGKASE